MNQNEVMKGIILAAGRGSRMRGLTDGQPKCRAKLKGKSLIEWQLDALRAGRLEQLAIVRGYLAGSFDFPVTYFDNPRWEQTNMVMSLVAADAWLKESSCVISYSDIVYSPRAVDTLRQAKGDIIIAYDPHWRRLWEMRFADPLADAETFRLAGDRLIEIGNRAATMDEIQGQYMGLFRLTPAGWKTITEYLATLSLERRDKLDVTSLLKELIKTGVNLTAVPITDKWYEVDSESDLHRYEALPSLWEEVKP